MTDIRLKGQLICSSEGEAEIIARHLDRHVELTRSEPGCVAFEVAATGDERTWSVEEVFRDAASFHEHQVRTADSEWGRATAGIERRYAIEGL
ncbi:putative quinol monooxygenase [Microbacterium sp. SS28]|uniref:putative quinol monooxygenase n=1 Tax=Microbacterium sp. SS28 TaxID=2919948 RepID=UPI001FA95467|nr:antibiotic biosynthesis monooxygenase [Microbacterium sp. SS28]